MEPLESLVSSGQLAGLSKNVDLRDHEIRLALVHS